MERLRAQDYFKDETFEGLDLAGFDFAGKEYFRCTFRHAKLAETRWLRSSLEDCVFEDCDLLGMQPGGGGGRAERPRRRRLSPTLRGPQCCDAPCSSY